MIKKPILVPTHTTSSRNRLVMGRSALCSRAHGLSVAEGRATVFLPLSRGR